MKWALIWWLHFGVSLATGHQDGFTTHKACNDAFVAMGKVNTSGITLAGVCVPLDERAP